MKMETKTIMRICTDCLTIQAVAEVPAIYSRNADGTPNGSRELVCLDCKAQRDRDEERAKVDGMFS